MLIRNARVEQEHRGTLGLTLDVSQTIDQFICVYFSLIFVLYWQPRAIELRQYKGSNIYSLSGI